MKTCSLECSVAAYAAVRLSFDEANQLRKQSDRLPGSMGNSILRHSDEQTLACLAAVRDAVDELEPDARDFKNWGVVGSSRYLGRSSFAQALTKFAQEGPWNVSVQVVPNRSLHSPASMISLALGCRGPCVGVGGGLDGETDAWITAASLLGQHKLSGMWLLFCGWDPDEHIDLEGNPLSESRCTALALALQPAGIASTKARLEIRYDSQAVAQVEIPAKTTALNLFESFLSSKEQLGRVDSMLGGCLRLEMNWQPAIETSIPLPQAIPAPLKKAA